MKFGWNEIKNIKYLHNGDVARIVCRTERDQHIAKMGICISKTGIWRAKTGRWIKKSNRWRDYGNQWLNDLGALEEDMVKLVDRIDKTLYEKIIEIGRALEDYEKKYLILEVIKKWQKSFEILKIKRARKYEKEFEKLRNHIKLKREK